MEDLEDFFATIGEVPRKLAMDKKEKWALKLFSQWTSKQPEMNAADSMFLQEADVTDQSLLTTVENKSQAKDHISMLLESTCDELDSILSAFIIDINTQRVGKRLYSPETIRQLVMSLQRFLRSNGRHVSLLTDPTFTQLQNCVALESFEVFSEGSPSCKYQTIITDEMEQDLWDRGYLGTDSAQTLLNTMVYLVGVKLGVASGSQLRKFSHKNGPIQLLHKEELNYIRYFPPKVKRKGSKDDPKYFDFYEETWDKNKGLVLVLKLYEQKCPDDRPDDVLFLKPLLKPSGNIWYSTQPQGKDALARTWKTLSEISPVKFDSETVITTCAVRHLNTGMNEGSVKFITGISKQDVEHLCAKQSVTQEYQLNLPILEPNRGHISKKRLIDDTDVVESHALALVSRCKQLYMPSVPVLQERLLSDILPTKLLSACIVDNIYLRDDSQQVSGKALRYYGFIMDLLQEVARELNINYDMRFVCPQRYGRADVRGRWTGLIGDVSNGECHLACAPLTITSTRSEVVDFTVPFATTTLTILYKKPPPGESLPFSNLRELLDSEVQVGTTSAGSTLESLQESKNPLLRKLFEKAEKAGPGAFLPDFPAGVRKVLEGNFALLLPRDWAQKFVNMYPDDFILIDTNMMQRHYGLALAKGSALTRSLNKVVLKLTESGFVDSLYEKWWELDSDPHTKQIFESIIKGNRETPPK